MASRYICPQCPKVTCWERETLTTSQVLRLLCRESEAINPMTTTVKPGDIYLYRGDKSEGTERGWEKDGERWQPLGGHILPDCPMVRKLCFNYMCCKLCPPCDPCNERCIIDRNYKKFVYILEKDDNTTVYALVHYLRCSPEDDLSD